jgi:hypothetical protein
MESTPQVSQGVQRLKDVFLGAPDTRLTLADASVVSGLDHAVCEVVLGALEDARFLTRTTDGRYRRRSPDTLDF